MYKCTTFIRLFVVEYFLVLPFNRSENVWVRFLSHCWRQKNHSRYCKGTRYFCVNSRTYVWDEHLDQKIQIKAIQTAFVVSYSTTFLHLLMQPAAPFVVIAWLHTYFTYCTHPKIWIIVVKTKLAYIRWALRAIFCFDCRYSNFGECIYLRVDYHTFEMCI